MHVLVLNAESAIIRIDLRISVIFVGLLLAQRFEVLLSQLAFLEYLELFRNFELLFDRRFFGSFLGRGGHDTFVTFSHVNGFSWLR